MSAWAWFLASSESALGLGAAGEGATGDALDEEVGLGLVSADVGGGVGVLELELCWLQPVLLSVASKAAASKQRE